MIEEFSFNKLFNALCENRQNMVAIQKIQTLTFLFECLAEFGRSKNSMAPQLYKLLISLLSYMLHSE
jgi:hypothetical protein